MALFSHKAQLTGVGTKKGTGMGYGYQCCWVYERGPVMGHGAWAGKGKAKRQPNSMRKEVGRLRPEQGQQRFHLSAWEQLSCLCLEFHHHLYIFNFLILQASPQMPLEHLRAESSPSLELMSPLGQLFAQIACLVIKLSAPGHHLGLPSWSLQSLSCAAEVNIYL